MRTEFDDALEARLMRYAAVETQSDPASTTRPSTAKQLELQRMLGEELRAIGASDVTLADYGAVFATLPATADGDLPVMGWLAHIDTAPQFTDKGVTPRVHHDYQGGEIAYPDAPDLILSPAVSPDLADKIGHDIITASGTTLLGADDKSGIAIIMTAAEHLVANPQIPRGPIRIAFTPDEEIGSGVQPDLVADLAADFAYTFDGRRTGGLEYETFSADGAVVTVTGVSIHPGDAKDTLVNALHLASRIVTEVATTCRQPEDAAGHEGFTMVTDLTGSAAQATLHLILRDYEMDGLEAKGAALRAICDRVADSEPRARITCEISHQYRNMRYWLDKDMTPVDLARAAYRACGIEPVSNPVRGGTDGSRLTEFGTPCPNIFTGMQMIHGPLEWISVQDMALATGVALKLAELAGAKT